MSDIIRKSNAELGSTLLEAAERKAQKETIEEAVGWTSKIMKDKQNALLWAEQNRIAADFYQKQLDAIAAGEFIVAGNKILKFTNDELNQPVQNIIKGIL